MSSNHLHDIFRRNMKEKERIKKGSLPIESKLKLPTPYEPLTNNRWLVAFTDDLDIEPYYLQSVSRPTFIKKKFLFFKRWEVSEMELSFVNPILNSTTEKLYNHVSKNLKINFRLEMLSPTGDVIEKWDISDCEILECNFGDLHYKDDGLLITKIRIKPKRAKLL